MAVATQWPLLKARLVELAPTLDGWAGVIGAVYDGPPTSNSPPANFATFGYTSASESGSYAQEQAGSGWETTETGSIAGELKLSRGDSTGSGVETACFAALNGLLAAVVADRRLGVLPPASSLSMTVTLAPVRNRQGSGYVARFSLNYTAVFS